VNKNRIFTDALVYELGAYKQLYSPIIGSKKIKEKQAKQTNI